MKRYSTLWYVISLLLVAGIGLAACSQATPQATSAPAATGGAPTAIARTSAKDLILSTTTSTQDSGLLDVLIPAFQQASGYTVKTASVGSGQALQMGKDCNADVLLVHSPTDEKTFMDGGYGSDRRLVMHNDFIVVGPKTDPANVQGTHSAVEAFTAIANAKAPFISRGDKSGTNSKELALWKAANITPAGDWYQQSGQGMGATLKIANEKDAYTLTDRATYLANRDQLESTVIVLEGDNSLLNVYHVIQVNPDKCSKLNVDGAKAFADYVVSAEGQALIAKFGVDKFGQALFTPDANRTDADLGLK
jgi:tungstate transport system substrate-binding protein